MRRTVFLALLSGIHSLVSGLSDSAPVDGIKSLEHLKFIQPSQSELQQIEQRHADALRVQAVNRTEPKLAFANYRHRNVTQSELAAAQKLVDQAAEEQSVYNEWVINNPRKNNYHHRSSGEQTIQRRGAPSRPTFSQATLDAIELVGNVDVQNIIDNGSFVAHEDDPKTAQLRARHLGEDYLNKRADVPGGPDPWWFSRLDHTGRPAFNGNSSYKTFRNVWDYGAIGNGVADDTRAIQRAISDGNRCGANCAGSTTTGAVVYLPPGTYRISSTLILYFDTQLVGYPGYDSTLKASTSFIGDALITCDVYLADGTSEWYLNTGNFYRNVRDLTIDIASASRPKNLMGIHWQVAQAASIENVIIFMSPKSSSSQVGIFAENGSGGWITNILTDGGLYGFLGGNQRYSINGFGAQNAKNGIGLIWDWTWSWTGVVIHDCDVGIDLTANGSSQAEPVGSFVLVDSFFQNVPTIIKTYLSTSTTQQGSTVITVSNTGFRDCGNFILLPNNQVVNPQGGISSTQINYLQLGDMVTHNDSEYGWFEGNITRPIELTTSGREGDWYPQRVYMNPPRPHYVTYTDSQILNANLVAKGTYLSVQDYV